jgi:hypothetical protein
MRALHGFMNYQCYYCKEEFPPVEAIDGYKKGYKIGFLCPNCGKNIQDIPMDAEWIFSRNSSKLFFAILTGYFYLAWMFLDFFELNTWVHYAVTLGGLVPFLVYGHIKHPKDMYSPRIGTKPVK